MPEFALEMRHISKTYGDVKANDAINLSVHSGTIHALAGENGAGKSTLMKILFGLVKPDVVQGAGLFVNGEEVAFSSPLDAIKKGIGMVQQHFALAGALTALDNIILGAEPRSGGLAQGFVDRDKAQEVLTSLAGQHLKAPWSRPVEDLSVGIQQRLEILKLLFRQADILILDEPTAVLTPHEVGVFFELLRKLRSQGKTVILITHKLDEVFSLSDDVTVLRAGRVVGQFKTAELTKEALVRAMIGREIKTLPKKVAMRGAEVVSCENLTVIQDNREIMSSVNLSIFKGEIVGVAGIEGNGQSTLVEVLLGLRSFGGRVMYKGQSLEKKTTAYIREKLNVGLISEDRHDQALWLTATVAENTAIGFTPKFSRFGFISFNKIKSWANEILKPYDVKMQSVDQPIVSLSGGNQQKIVVAREVSARRPDFLIASQPTRGVDVGAIEFIHDQLFDLRDRGGAILLVSSELEELCALSDRIVVMYQGRIVEEFQGPQFDLGAIGHAMTSGQGRSAGVAIL